MRISDWSSDVCSSDLSRDAHRGGASSMGVSTSLDTNGERGAAKNERFVAVSYIVIPAKAGIQSARRLIPRWVPAFAGMTYLWPVRSPSPKPTFNQEVKIGRAHV